MSEDKPRTPFYRVWAAKYETWSVEIAQRWFRLLEWLIVTSAFMVAWTKTHDPVFLVVTVVSYTLILAWTAYHIVPPVAKSGMLLVVRIVGARRLVGPPPPPVPPDLDRNDKGAVQRYLTSALQSQLKDPSSKRAGRYFFGVLLTTFGIIVVALAAVSFALFSALTVLSSAAHPNTF